MSESIEWSGVVAVEGCPTKDGRMIEPGAIILPKGQVALVAQGDWRIIGYAENFTRNGNLIWASGVLHREEDLQDFKTAGGLAASIQKAEYRKGSYLTIVQGTLNAVLSTDSPPWPESVIH